MDIEFSSLEELYKRLKPALTTKCDEIKRAGYTYLKEEDIWNYLKEIKWRRSVDLSLYEMVSDILNLETEKIDLYLKEKLERMDRKVYFNE
jgi:hypothetical protein